MSNDVLELSQGNTYSIIINVTNPDGSIKDLTGTISMKFALAARRYATPLIELTYGTDNELTLVNAELGQIRLVLNHTELNTLPEGRYYFEIRQVNVFNEPITLVKRDITIRETLIKQ